MRYLLDTHTILWWRADDPRLPERLNPVLEGTEENEVFFSVVSLWEIAIKRSLGKLKLKGTLEDFARTLESDHGFLMLPISVSDLARVEKLPFHHRDPFDRLLIAQCLECGARAVTNDARWDSYPVETTW